jgi:hypothetical protein
MNEPRIPIRHLATGCKLNDELRIPIRYLGALLGQSWDSIWPAPNTAVIETRKEQAAFPYHIQLLYTVGLPPQLPVSLPEPHGC